MIRAFFDESEFRDVFLVAGWVADCETWSRFTEDWQSVLDAEPRIDYFKHHEAKGFTGQFSGWSESDAEAKIAALVDVVCRHEMYGVVSGLSTDVHKAAFAGSTVPWKVLRSVLKTIHPYQWCVFSAHSTVLQVQIDKGQSKRVDCVFDEMDGLMAQCIEKYDELKSRLPEEKRAIAGTLTEADDKRVAALQAADLLAGQRTRSIKLQMHEPHYVRMWTAHYIAESLAYLPNLEQIPDLLKLVDLWFSMRVDNKNKE